MLCNRKLCIRGYLKRKTKHNQNEGVCSSHLYYKFALLNKTYVITRKLKVCKIHISSKLKRKESNSNGNDA